MVDSPVVLGLTAALCWGTADYLSKSQSKRVGSYKTVVYTHVVTLAVLLALIPVLRPSLAAPVDATVVLLVCGVVNFAAFNLLYDAFHRGAVSVVAPVAYTYPAVTVALSVLVLRASLSAAEALAISGVILGVVLLSTRVSELRAYRRGGGTTGIGAGVLSAVGSSVFFGSVYLGIGYAAPVVSYFLPVVLLRGVGACAGLVLAPLLGQDVKPSRAALSGTVFVMGTLEAAGFLAFTYGILNAGGSLPVVAALSGLGGAVATAYAMTFLKERLETNQMVGVLLAVAGVIVLLYLGG